MVDDVVTHRTLETGQWLSSRCGAPTILPPSEMSFDVIPLLLVISQAAQCSLNGLVDNGQITATDELLNLIKPRSGSMPVVSQSIMNEMVPVEL